jgi:hypothetical protein
MYNPKEENELKLVVKFWATVLIIVCVIGIINLF